MNRSTVDILKGGSATVILLSLLIVLPVISSAQNFDYDKLQVMVNDFSVIVEMKIEISFGIHTSEQEERYLGTIVSEDGLVIFNGIALSADYTYSSYSGYTVKTTPTAIDVTTLDGRKFYGEYIGVDRFTKIGFIKIIDVNDETFKAVKFQDVQDFTIGSWVTLYMLLPEFISPPLAADVGMISSIVESPEFFPLTVGFNSFQTTSVLFNERLEPVGVLGVMNDPSRANIDPGGLLESFNQYGVPLLGIITGDRLERQISNPPRKGKVDRGWLGITLQALTTDIGEFWRLNITGGIIVNDIVKKSPADMAGLRIGDVIYEVNGQQVEVDKDEIIPVFQRLISELGPGTSVEFSVLRRDEEGFDTLRLLATLQQAPLAATDAPEYENKALEFKIRDLVFADYLYFNLDSETFHGVVVSELKAGGLADIEGLLIGDIVQRIGNKPVYSIDDVSTILEEAENDKPGEIIFFVWRNKKTMFVNLKTDWK